MTTEQKYDCIFCKDVFDDKEALQIHFRKHGDPNFNKISNHKTRTQNDEAANDKSEENEMVGCDVCEEVFTTISKAITHKHKVHPDHDAKYFCPFCGKVFTMKHLYNKHVQTNHSDESSSSTKDFYCECCEVAFYGAPAMLYHNKFFHRQDTELPAIGQSKKVKLYNQELLQIFYCAFCGEEYNNKVNLHKHMGDEHSDENQRPTEVMRCPLCEAIFYHLDAYEVHLTFHSIEDLYSEKNEVAEGVTEFSLESVPPIVEKVVDDEQLEADQNAEGIDSFLQLVMSESETPEKVKVKKHKKHKKSKKASITLDEFLNMNKDVFGDGLDVQGIEEVPTPFVLKKPKVKKAANKVVNADLAKLKKIGITVKTKTGYPVVANVKKNTPIQLNTTLPAKIISKPNVQSSPNDIISKLMNQGNSQIKIVKKSVAQNTITQNPLDNSNSENVTESSNTNINNESFEGDAIINNDNSNMETNMNASDIPPEDKDNKKLHVSEENDKYCSKNEEDLENIEQISLNSVNNEKLESNKESESDDFENKNCEKSTLQDNIDANIENETSPKSSHDLSTSNCGQNNNEKFNTDLNTSEEQHNDGEQEVDNIANKTLSALRHLSHLLTVKPLNQNNNMIKPGNCAVKNAESKDDPTKGNIENVKETKLDQKQPLKNLGEHITIKPSKSSPSLQSNIPSDVDSEDGHPDPDSDFDNEDNNSTENNVNPNKSLTDMPNQEHSPSYQEKTLSLNHSQSNIFVPNKVKETDDIKTEDCPKKMANLNILKRLTNVTAKPIAPQSPQFNNKPKKTVSTLNTIRKVINKGKIDDEIEVFNIDDSDSEDNEHIAVNSVSETKKNNSPLDALKYLNKNITIKSNQQTNSKVTTYRAESSFENYTKFNKQTPEIQKSINLQNKLKNFGSHITVKSRNTSPISRESTKNCFDEEVDEQEYDSGPDAVGKVKITEVNEDDHVSDEDFNENELNAIVESPHASQSENEDFDDDVDEEAVEKIKASPKQNNVVPPKKTATGLESFKNLNKELTIKSLTKNSDTEEKVSQIRPKKVSEETKSTNKEQVIKQFKQNTANDQSINKSMQQASSSTNQSFNQKVSTSSNQVTKTVKRFQSKTVIEEITTTVTKTIRTVNQSTNEEVQSTSQYPPRPTIRPQKIINRPPQPGREYQGTAIRHVAPTVGTKIRSTGTAIRSPKPAIVRPSNQLVPVRSSTNLVRPALPGTSTIRKTLPPKMSPQRPAIGKLKISPNAISQTKKRPSDEVGNFTCFKKPKDALPIPPEFQDDDDESTTQFSASQSQTKFSSVTKTVKGKGGGVTAIQMKSEVSTSSQQQLNKLSNVSGLKIVKTNSSHKVEEKCEMTAAKKNTLEALEKLQKHGLLIKKPRIEEYSDPTNSFSESDGEESEK